MEVYEITSTQATQLKETLLALTSGDFFLTMDQWGAVESIHPFVKLMAAAVDAIVVVCPLADRVIFTRPDRKLHLVFAAEDFSNEKPYRLGQQLEKEGKTGIFFYDKQ